MIGGKYGSAPLHFACMKGLHPDLIEMILKQEHRRQAAAHQLDHQIYGLLVPTIMFPSRISPCGFNLRKFVK